MKMVGCIIFSTFIYHIYGSLLHDGDVEWLKSPRVTPWGQFGPHEFCPKNSFVTGMRLRMDHKHAGDNTALNAIQLVCTDVNGADSKNINSASGSLGHFGEIKYCTNGFATGFQLRSQNGQGYLKDDVAAVDFKLLCTDTNGHLSEVIADDNGFLPWGHWTQAQFCPAKSAVCGIATQVEDLPELLRTIGKQDQTSLNNVDIACCPLTRPIETCQLKYNWETIITCANEAICVIKLAAGLAEAAQQTKFRKFYDNHGSVGDFNEFVMKSLQVKAEKYPEKIDNNSLENIVQQTKMKWNKAYVSVKCESTIQQLVVSCDFIKLYTDESRCVPDQYADKEGKGLYFQPASRSETIFWSYNCDFVGGDIASVASETANCGELCVSNMECNHFVWNDFFGGTCWLKGNLTVDSPVERYHENILCGWVKRP